MTLHARIEVWREGFAVTASLRAGPGTTVALLGPNGAGKSTVVSCLAGLTPADAGLVRLDGRTLEDPVEGLRVPPERRPVGVMFQDLLLLPHLTALDNVAFPLRARGARRGEARRRAEDLLGRLGVSARRSARPARLSGGEAQRVALARALIAEPRLLLLDEPTASLDVAARAAFRPLLRSILSSFGGVRVLVTHDPVEALTLGNHLVVMEEGAVTQAGSPAEIRERPRTRYAAEVVGVNLFAGRLRPLEPGAGVLATAEGDLVVGRPEGAPASGGDALGILRPADVAIHLARPEGGSARNVLYGPVAAISLEPDRARVRIASAPPVIAEVTLGSVERLGLRQGTPVWASFKAVEVRVVLA